MVTGPLALAAVKLSLFLFGRSGEVWELVARVFNFAIAARPRAAPARYF
jgi:hypothetical protein